VSHLPVIKAGIPIIFLVIFFPQEEHDFTVPGDETVSMCAKRRTYVFLGL